MNWYKFHIGDYVAATAHLSWEEDLAYRRLLDHIYKSETPLPAEVGQVCRLIRANTPDQRQAVEVVLHEFFELADEGWQSRRFLKEVAAVQDKANKNRKNGKLGGRPPGSKTKVVLNGNHDGFQPETQTNLTQDTKIQDTKIQDTRTPVVPVTVDTEVEAHPGFDRFWEQWPTHKRKAARDQCLARWRAKDCEDNADAIIAAVRSSKLSDDWKKDGGHFIPAPLTWLNQKRWEAPSDAEVAAAMGGVRRDNPLHADDVLEVQA